MKVRKGGKEGSSGGREGGRKETKSRGGRTFQKRVFVSSPGGLWPCQAAVAGLARPQSRLGAAVGGTSVLAGF